MKLNLNPFNKLLFVLTISLYIGWAPKSATAQTTATSTNITKKAKTSKKTTKPIPMDSRVKIGTLPNGLTYYIQQNSKPENRAEFRIALKAGSIVENEDEQGLAHFVEHMCFNGTRNFKKSELIDFIEGAGLRFGADLNAVTSFDQTIYMLPVRTDSPELLETGLDIIEDWSGYVTFENEEIDKERGVVESERTSGKGAKIRMIRQWLPKLFKGSQYTNRLPIGTSEVINGASYATIKNFYKKWYRPNLMAIICVGDFDPEMIEKEIIERFSKLENPKNEVERKQYDIPVIKEPVVAIVTDKEANNTTASVYYRLQNKKIESISDMRNSIMERLYANMINARLSELAQSATPPFVFGYSYKGGLLPGADAYVSSTTTPEGGVMKGLEAVLTENQRVIQHGFTATELDRAKENLIKNLERGVKEKDKVDNQRYASRYSYHFLENNPIPSPEQRLKIYSKYMPTIRVKHMNKLTEEWLSANLGLAILVNAPEPKAGQKMPTESELLALLDQVSQKSTTPYQDEVASEPLYTKTLEPVAITKEEKNEKFNITTLELANGVKVILKPTDFKNDEILMSAFSPGGHSLVHDDLYITAKNTSTIVNMSGIASFDNTLLNKLMTGKTAKCYPYITDLEEGFDGNCSPDDFELMLQLVDLYFTAPRSDEEAMKSFIARQSAMIANMTQNPEMNFYSELYKIKNGGHQRGIIFDSPEDLAKIKLDDVMNIYKDRFADASDFTFVLVGNFEVENTKQMVAKYLGNLPSINRNETWKDPNIPVLSETITKEIRKGIDDQSFVGVVYEGEFDWDNAKERAIFTLTTKASSIKLRETMREDKGGVYGVEFSGSLSKTPKEKFDVVMNFTTKEDQVEEMLTSAMTVLDKIASEGVDEVTLNKVKAQSIEAHKKGLNENKWWLKSIEAYTTLNLKIERLDADKQAARINAVTNNDIKAMAKRILSTKGKATIIQKPEQK